MPHSNDTVMADANNTGQALMPIYLKPREAAAVFGYRDVKSFLEMARRRGIPGMRKLNERVIRFHREQLLEWSGRN